MGRHALPRASRPEPTALVRERVRVIIRQAAPQTRIGLVGKVSGPTVWRASAIASMAVGGALYLSVGSPAYAVSDSWVIPELGQAAPQQLASQVIPELETPTPQPHHGTKGPLAVMPREAQYLRKNDNLPQVGQVVQSDQPVLPNLAPPAHPSKLRSAMVHNALADVGHIHEAPPGSNRGPDIRRLTGGVDGIEWCAAEGSSVVNKTAKQLGLPSPIFGGSSYGMHLPDDVLIRVNQNPSSPDVMSLQQWGQAVGAYHSADSYQPQPGDIAIFRGHTGVVVDVGGDLATADGNWGNQDQVVHRSLDSSFILGYINIEEAFAAHGPAPAVPAASAPVQPTAPAPAELPAQPDVPAVPGIAAPEAVTANAESVNDTPVIPGAATVIPIQPASPAPAADPAPSPDQAPQQNAVQSQIPLASVDYFNANVLPKVQALQPLYQKVALEEGVPWQLLAAIDHEESGNSPDRSSLAGEDLGSPNPDHPNLVMHSKEESLHVTARYLKGLSLTMYGVHISPLGNSLSDLEEIAVAYNRGGLYLKAGVAADRSPYAANGLDSAHQNMSWVGPPADTVSGVDQDLVGAVTVYVLLGGPVSS